MFSLFGEFSMTVVYELKFFGFTIFSISRSSEDDTDHDVNHPQLKDPCRDVPPPPPKPKCPPSTILGIYETAPFFSPKDRRPRHIKPRIPPCENKMHHHIRPTKHHSEYPGSAADNLDDFSRPKNKPSLQDIPPSTFITEDFTCGSGIFARLKNFFS